MTLLNSVQPIGSINITASNISQHPDCTKCEHCWINFKRLIVTHEASTHEASTMMWRRLCAYEYLSRCGTELLDLGLESLALKVSTDVSAPILQGVLSSQGLLAISMVVLASGTAAGQGGVTGHKMCHAGDTALHSLQLWLVFLYAMRLGSQTAALYSTQQWSVLQCRLVHHSLLFGCDWGFSWGIQYCHSSIGLIHVHDVYLTLPDPCENAPRVNATGIWWTNVDINDMSTLVQVMAWCCQATSYYLSQCW